MRQELIAALLAHANGEIAMHKANVEVYLNNPVGIGEHPDITEAMQQELDKIARWHDQIEVINKYFKKQRKYGRQSFWGEPTPTDVWDDMQKLDHLYEELMWDHRDKLEFAIEGNHITIRNRSREGR